MKISLTRPAKKQLQALPSHLQKKARKQFNFLLVDIKHPSLDIKKYQGFDDLWQGRIDKGYRFYFHIVEPDYIIISIINHPK
jgi:mRNA-degrading endonuclease RelE of RelBE toxin-antitoxin system